MDVSVKMFISKGSKKNNNDRGDEFINIRLFGFNCK